MISIFKPPTDGQILSAFDEMLICHKRAQQAQSIFDSLREAKRLSPNTPKNWVALFAPSFSGKTRAVMLYMERVIDDAIASGRFPPEMTRNEIGKAQTKVIYLSIPSSNVTQKTVITMLLARLGDPLPDKGNTGQQLQRLYELMHKLGVELVILDEMQHLSAAMREGARSRSKDGQYAPIPYLIKTLLDNGHVPIVCIGITEGRSHLMSNNELRNRCFKELDFLPIKPDSIDMLEVLAKYFGMLANKIVEYGLFPDVPDFISGEIPDCFVDVSGGKIGEATMLARSACCFAAHRGARCVEYEDLEAATDEAIAAGKVKINFFRLRREKKERERERELEMAG
ncbi:MAG: TniB family NTP-binding protein [Mesorhizobium sp.]